MSLYKTVSRAIMALCLFFLVQTSGIFIFGIFPHGQKADAAVVLGSKVFPNSLPSKRLVTRLQSALHMYEDQRVSWVIVSGGTGIEGVDESHVMRNWLEQRGVPSEKIIQDLAGSSTWETAKNVHLLLQQRPEIKTVAIVTSNYHILRTGLALGLWNVPVSASRPAEFMIDMREPYQVSREWFGLAAYPLMAVFN